LTTKEDNAPTTKATSEHDGEYNPVHILAERAFNYHEVFYTVLWLMLYNFIDKPSPHFNHRPHFTEVLCSIFEVSSHPNHGLLIEPNIIFMRQDFN
jgi:hypothetical protein